MVREDQLYYNLMDIVDNNEAFYYKDFVVGSDLFRIFSHRLASYSDFLNQDALEARGIMYKIDNGGKPFKLSSRPLHKFFNINENPFTMNVDLNKIKSIELKADGSLISTYYIWNDSNNPELRVKSKGSTESQQVYDVMNFLNKPSNDSFKKELFDLTFYFNLTVILEWCSPENRVIINYDEPQLTVLAVRGNSKGDYLPKEEFKDYPNIYNNWINQFTVEDPKSFVEQIPDMEGIEGYVVKTDDLWMKVKTNWYLTQHRAKESVDSDESLYKAVLSEAADDLKSLFFDNPAVLKRIERMEKVVHKTYNHFVNNVETFYEHNKHLERKDFAIKAQKHLSKSEFNVAMMKYSGKDINSYKQLMLDKWKHFKHLVQEEI